MLEKLHEIFNFQFRRTLGGVEPHKASVVSEAVFGGRNQLTFTRAVDFSCTRSAGEMIFYFLYIYNDEQTLN